ncbi:MAG: DUF1349 domain-containing protein [Bacillota bacterium]|nr:DUF1349 domain-containing protein [Bacillota bacterium]
MDILNNCELLPLTTNYFKIKASPRTDYFIDRLTKVNITNAPFYYETVDFDFEIQVHIKPIFCSTYDAGGILILDDNEHWIKAAFELTDLGYHSIVSVVTNETSDDCNGEIINNDSIFLRILRRGDYFAIHHSDNGVTWKMNRYFQLNLKRKIKIGLIAQSPVGNGIEVDFSDLVIAENRYQDLRNGK